MRTSRVPNRLLLAGSVCAALAAALTGCSHTVAVGSKRVLRVALTEYRVVPQSVQARSGPLTLIVENEGRLTHNLAVTSKGTVIGQTPPIQPGQSADLFITLSAGSYVMSSTLFADQALGVYGTLTVIS